MIVDKHSIEYVLAHQSLFRLGDDGFWHSATLPLRMDSLAWVTIEDGYVQCWQRGEQRPMAGQRFEFRGEASMRTALDAACTTVRRLALAQDASDAVRSDMGRYLRGIVVRCIIADEVDLVRGEVLLRVGLSVKGDSREVANGATMLVRCKACDLADCIEEAWFLEVREIAFCEVDVAITPVMLAGPLAVVMGPALVRARAARVAKAVVPVDEEG